ncbi:MAG: hypothetical protein ACFFCX_15280 [Candidatus Sifarchaeia archaeon]
MTERPSIEASSLVGRALLLQAFSAILIIGSLLIFVTGIIVNISGVAVMSVLYMIGFVQMLVTRYVMQGEAGGITVAFVVAIIAFLVSLIVGFYWIIQTTFPLIGIFYIIVGMVNTILIGLLQEVRKGM